MARAPLGREGAPPARVWMSVHHLHHLDVAEMSSIVEGGPAGVVHDADVHRDRPVLFEHGHGLRRLPLHPAGDVEGRRALAVLGVGGGFPAGPGEERVEHPRSPVIDGHVQRHRAHNLDGGVCTSWWWHKGKRIQKGDGNRS